MAHGPGRVLHAPLTVNQPAATGKTIYTLTRAAMYTGKREIAGKAGKTGPGKKAIFLNGPEHPARLLLPPGPLPQERAHQRNVPLLRYQRADPGAARRPGDPHREVATKVIRNAAHRTAPGKT